METALGVRGGSGCSKGLEQGAPTGLGLEVVLEELRLRWWRPSKGRGRVTVVRTAARWASGM